MKEYSGISSFSKLDLRRLWPVISTTIYPETLQRIASTVDDARNAAEQSREAECEELLREIQRAQELMESHTAKVKEIVASRLSAYPYGHTKYPADYFANLCEQHAISSAEIKTYWNNIRILARRVFGRTRSTAAEKLALARLNSTEQDVLYILFVEHQYICPLILRPTE